MQERLDSLFGRATPGWVPVVDLYETAGAYVVAAELPGMSRDDFQIDIAEHTLTLRGRRTDAGRGHRYQQLECGLGQFSRSFRFADDIDPDSINAEFRDGVLIVTVPKKAAGGPRRIEVT